MKERSSNTWLSIGAYARAFGLNRATVKKLLAAKKLEHWCAHGLTRIKNAAPPQHHAQK